MLNLYSAICSLFILINLILVSQVYAHGIDSDVLSVHEAYHKHDARAHVHSDSYHDLQQQKEIARYQKELKQQKKDDEEMAKKAESLFRPSHSEFLNSLEHASSEIRCSRFVE